MNVSAAMNHRLNLMEHPCVGKDEPMARHTTFRIGGPAQYFAMPQSWEELVELISLAKQENVPVMIMGGGSNLLVADSGVSGLLICTRKMKSGIELITGAGQGSQLIRAEAGEGLSSLVKFSGDNGLAGLEFAAGIPGTLGGAIVMNAGIKGRSMEDVIHSVRLLDMTGPCVREVKRQDLVFSYRSLELGNAVVLGASLCLTKDNAENVSRRIREQVRLKKKNQPVQSASAGCFFKNPSPEMSAGYLIDRAGGKGMTYNQARVSDIHANYIVNMGKASCSDVLELARMVSDRVFAQYNLRLEPEIRVVNHDKKA